MPGGQVSAHHLIRVTRAAVWEKTAVSEAAALDAFAEFSGK